MASPILPALDTLATLASAAAAEAASAVQERERVPDPVRGWYGDGDAMRALMPGAIVKSTDGSKHYVIPITGAVKRNADGIKVRLGEWAGSDSPLRDADWVQANCGDALIKFLPGKLPGSSTARLGMATVIDEIEYTVHSLPAP